MSLEKVYGTKDKDESIKRIENEVVNIKSWIGLGIICLSAPFLVIGLSITNELMKLVNPTLSFGYYVYLYIIFIAIIAYISADIYGLMKISKYKKSK